MDQPDSVSFRYGWSSPFSSINYFLSIFGHFGGGKFVLTLSVVITVHKKYRDEIQSVFLPMMYQLSLLHRNHKTSGACHRRCRRSGGPLRFCGRGGAWGCWLLRVLSWRALGSAPCVSCSPAAVPMALAAKGRPSASARDASACVMSAPQRGWVQRQEAEQASRP